GHRRPDLVRRGFYSGRFDAHGPALARFLYKQSKWRDGSRYRHAPPTWLTKLRQPTGGGCDSPAENATPRRGHVNVTKNSTGNFFEDLRIGQFLTHATPRTVTAGDVALYNG